MINQNNTRQVRINSSKELNLVNKPAEIYTEQDWFDCKATANHELPILHRRNEQHHKSFLERFGFGTYREMKDCEKDGLR